MSLLEVDTGLLEPAAERRFARGAADHETLVLGWQDVPADSETPEWRAARLTDPSEPVAQPLPALPLPGLVAMFPVGAGVRMVFTVAPSPRDGITQGGFADLLPDDTFGPTTTFDVALGGAFVGGGLQCEGVEAVALYLHSGDGTEDWGATLLDTTGGTPRLYPPVWGLGRCAAGTSVELDGCVASDGIASLLVHPCPLGSALAVLRWRTGDGGELGRPVALGAGARWQTGLAALDPAAESRFFVFEGGAGAHVRAYRVVGGDADQVASTPLDPFPDPFVQALGYFALGSELLLTYAQQGSIVSVLAFSSEAGFGTPVIATDAGCSSASKIARRVGIGTYLPCAGPDATLFLLELCGNERP